MWPLPLSLPRLSIANFPGLPAYFGRGEMSAIPFKTSCRKGDLLTHRHLDDVEFLMGTDAAVNLPTHIAIPASNTESNIWKPVFDQPLIHAVPRASFVAKTGSMSGTIIVSVVNRQKF